MKYYGTGIGLKKKNICGVGEGEKKDARLLLRCCFKDDVTNHFSACLWKKKKKSGFFSCPNLLLEIN